MEEVKENKKIPSTIINLFKKFSVPPLAVLGSQPPWETDDIIRLACEMCLGHTVTLYYYCSCPMVQASMCLFSIT